VVSSVLSVTPVAIPANDDLRPRTFTTPSRRSGNPHMTPEQGNECHQGAWNDAEIVTFIERSVCFRAKGRADAQHLAERLVLRDRQADDRHFCVECRELGASGRCGAAVRGAITGADRRLEPTQNILMRCTAFSGSDPHHR
jgi:hypothetical protein